MLWQRLLKIEETSDAFVVHFIAAKIRDAENIHAIQEKLISLVSGREGSSFVFDLKEVDYLSSAALGIFMTLHKKITASDGRLVLRNLSSDVYELFQVTKLDQLFDITPRKDTRDPS